jgi:hypothetical protein
MKEGKQSRERLKIPLNFDEAVSDFLKVKPPPKPPKKKLGTTK